jgi:copper(I)-binding protein
MQRLIPLLLLAVPSAVLAELEISEAWVKHLPASVPVRAGYMTIHNPADRPASIVGARSEAFASVEIHQTRMQDGMMRMDPVPKLEIDAGGSVQLAPGGLHLMMMQPAEPTRPGQILRITLEYGDGSEQGLELTVRK